jgi:hypothetical protein
MNYYLVGALYFVKIPWNCCLIKTCYCQDLQAEHINMRIVDCIDDYYAIMNVGPARSLIPWCSALIQIRGKPATNPSTGIYRDSYCMKFWYQRGGGFKYD